MRRGPGQQPTSGGSGITVNQSQGFDTSAFSVRSASPAAAAVGAPQPSASESSPKPQRRRTSGDTAVGIDAGSSGSTDSNSLRRSLELDRQQQSSAFLPLPSMEDRRGKSSSGPINTQQQPHQQQQPQQQSQTPPPGVTSPVRRTRSLKENLMQRFNSSMVGGGASVGIARVAGVTSVSPAPSEDSPKSFPPPSGEEAFNFDLRHAALTPRTPAAAAAGGSRSSSPKKAAQEAASKQQPVQMSRNRAGSLRGGSVVKVLPDKKLLNKASSSENLTNQNAAAADLNSLASLVQKKRDRSQESLEQAKTGGSGGISGSRKPPTPTPAVDSDDGSEVAAAKSKPPSGMARGANSRRLESPTSSGRGTAVVAAALLPAATDDSPAEANDTDRESPGEEQQSDGEVAAQAAGSHNHSSSLEFLMQDAQSRTAPQIRHPSARKIEYTSSAAAAAAAARREGSPSKILGAGGSSPPKAVSFNPNDEIKTYEGDYHSRYKKHHRSGSSSHSQRQQQHHQRQHRAVAAATAVAAMTAATSDGGGDRNGHGEAWGSGRIGDNALIEVHSAMVESMDKMVAKQRQFLSQVKEGSITVSEYREVMKSLLTMQTKTIHQILDAIQSNEKPS
ncbi:hypothetical protein BOX15_Mlig026940g1 [Macrostomum lignano]|uniref:Uncharacterized protein n=1 Tax=Macrostomum lignano TaxID=282301 RepID=A0A267F670_9PLAT|nr:hypothetical protein BOX15_Mlig026940g1 [Macrostomum lignano]